MKVKEESEKAGLKFNIQKTKTTASGPITSWQTDGETVPTVTHFIFQGFKITAAMKLQVAWSLEDRLWQNLNSVLKSRDITLGTKVHLVKALVFPVLMYGCENWTIKKAECRRMLPMLKKTLESPLDSKEIKSVNPKRNQSWIFTGGTDAKDDAPVL